MEGGGRMGRGRGWLGLGMFCDEGLVGIPQKAVIGVY